MDIRVKVVRQGDGFRAWCPEFPSRWLAHATTRREICRKIVAAVVGFYDIQLGLPRRAIWISLPPNKGDQAPSVQDLLIVLGPGRREIRFRLEPKGPAAAASLVGDFTQWRQRTMHKTPGTAYATSLKLGPGIYGYQYVVNGARAGGVYVSQATPASA